MNIITISREFGSGGRELGKRLADMLGYDYYDSQIITAIAAKKGMDEEYVGQLLESSIQSIPLTYAHSFVLPVPSQMEQLDLLVEQKRVIEKIGKEGRDCVIVGRNADIYLEQYKPLSIFVCADMDSKVERCTQRAEAGEDTTPKKLVRKIKQIDKNRRRTREFIGGNEWGDPHNYHLVVNTQGWDIKELTPVVAEFVKKFNERG